MPRKNQYEDLTGRVYGRWTVLGFSHHHKGSKIYWRCRCECGTEKAVYGYYLKMGRTHSCGCLCFENTGREKTDEYIPSPEEIAQECRKLREGFG